MVKASSISIGELEFRYVNECLSSCWLTQGKFVRRLEERFADLHGVKHAVSCSSGTAALHLAMLAMNVDEYDTVIVPALTYVATANAARYCGARVAFCDVLPESWTIDPYSANNVADRLVGAGKTVVVPVHLYDAIASLDGCYTSNVITDSAQAVGIQKDQELGKISTFSFYASKVIACGEGGMLVTNSDDMAMLARLYRGQGATIPGRYHHSVVGYNYRMTDLHAAVALAQLERLPEFLATRRGIVLRYQTNLRDSSIQLQGGPRASGWAVGVVLPDWVSRDHMVSALASYGIETRPFFQTISSLPPYAGSGCECPVAEDVSRRGLVLPTHADMSLFHVDEVCDVLLNLISLGAQ